VAQVKCLRVLQYFPPPEDPAVGRALNEVLRRVITGSEVAKNVNKNNAQHAIVFEAIALALALEADPALLTAGGTLPAFLTGTDLSLPSLYFTGGALLCMGTDTWECMTLWNELLAAWPCLCVDARCIARLDRS
jgi:AP-2 complex subunit alpha